MRGQGAELPCGVWGNAPTVFRALSSKGTVNKCAGSEASLPVTKKPSKCSSSNIGVCCEAVQRATAKPSGRLRRGEILAYGKDQLWSEVMLFGRAHLARQC